MSTLLLVVALISLVVGGVGIMNIMLVSGHRADARDRPADGRRHRGPRHPAAVPRRGRGAVLLRRRRTASWWAGVLDPGPLLQHWPTETSLAAMIAARGRVGHRGHGLRLLSGLEGLAARPHRSPAVRMSRMNYRPLALLALKSPKSPWVAGRSPA